MASSQTEHYGLSQWESSDVVRREDFNADNRKLDEALHTLASGGGIQIVFGSYAGNDATTRTISLGVTPKAVYVCTKYGYTYFSPGQYGGLALEGIPARGTSDATGEVDLIRIVEGGFTVRNGNVQSGGGFYLSANLSGMTYHYLAFY